MKKNGIAISKLATTAIFTAIVAVLQLTGGSVKIGPVSFSLVLIPIVVGGAVVGPVSGAMLGCVFGIITLLNGLTGADVFTNFLLNASGMSAVCTVVLCLIKGTAAGFFPALIYRGLSKKNERLGVFVAAAAAPIINTGIFILFALTALSGTIASSGFVGDNSLIYFIFIGCAGVNFLVEFAINIIFAPAIYTIIRAIAKRR